MTDTRLFFIKTQLFKFIFFSALIVFFFSFIDSETKKYNILKAFQETHKERKEKKRNNKQVPLKIQIKIMLKKNYP